MGKRKKSKSWTEAEAVRVLNRADASGLSDARYAKKRGIHPSRLYWWRAKLGRSKRGSKKSRRKEEGFVEVRPAVSTPAAMVEVTLLNGRRVTVPTNVDPNQLGALLEVVERGTC